MRTLIRANNDAVKRQKRAAKRDNRAARGRSRAIAACATAIAALAILAAGCGDSGVNSGGKSEYLDRFLDIFSKNPGGRDAPATFTLTIDIFPLTGGTVERNPDASDAYNAGTEVILTAKPSPGYEFYSWSGAKSSTSPEITITMEKNDKVLTAAFKKEGDGLPEYIIRFAPNGGSYPPGEMHALKGYSITLPDQASMEKNGYTFAGWNEDSASGAFYAARSSYTVTHDATTLYAKWLPIDTVTFNGNGADAGAPGAVVKDSGTVITLPNQGSMTRGEWYYFGGWNTNSDGTGTDYAADSSYTVQSNATLYAKWIPIYTVTFNINGATAGNAPTAIIAGSGTAITLPLQGNISRDKHNFGGWNTESSGTGTNYDAGSSYTIQNNATLYAKWILLPPDAPTSVTATAASSSSIDVSWPAVPYATGYIVYYSATTASGNYNYLRNTTYTSYTHTELSPGATYCYKVSAYNSAGESEKSSSYDCATIVLNPPSCVSASATSSSSITVSWCPVTGATGYDVYRSTTGVSGPYSYLTSATGTTFTNTGLSPGTTYHYSVASYNGGGASVPSSSYGSATTFPNAPSSVTATAASSSSIDVSWSAVTGATGYYVYRSTSSSGPFEYYETNTTSTSFTNIGLSPGTPYYYRVKAYNSGGTSDLSSSFGSAITQLNAPASFTATPTSSSSIALSWSAVTGATGYYVYRSTSSSGTSSLLTNTSSTSFTNTGLSSGTTYYYSINAYNSNNAASAPSYASAMTFLDPPSSVTATPASSSSITVSWSTVTGATGYNLYRSTSASGTYGFVASTTSTSYTNTGLPSGTTYYYKVSAYNSAGEEGSISSYYGSAMTITVPPPPSCVSASSTLSSSITISWCSVTGATGYNLYLSTSASGTYSFLASTTSTSYTITGLSSGTTYYYKVSAYNSAGEGSIISSSYTPIPAAPTSVTATAASSSSITVSWSAVTGATGYYLYRSTSASGTYSLVTSTTSTSLTNTGLSSGTTYYYKVSAYNSGGEGSMSSSYGSAAPITVPAPPSSVTATTASSSSITVSWSAVTGATGYYLYRSTSASGTYSYVTSTTSTSFTNTGLSSGTTYYYKVSTYNSGGEGSISSSYGSATTIPAIPSNVYAYAASSSSIDVSWSSVTGATGYDVYRSTSASGTYSYVASTTYTSFTNTGLLSGTTYYYKVSAYNGGGGSSQSSYASATTPASAVVSSTVISETFENGTNNWVLVNGSQTNKWMIGSSTSYGGIYSAYISNDNLTNSYTITTESTVHMYKDITFPTSGSDFTLTFYFKGVGESTQWDYMSVYYSTTSYTPSAGSTFSNGTLLGTYYYNSSWTQKTITLPAAAFSGKTIRLVFSWRNDSIFGQNPPAAIDNIIITTP